MRYGSERIRKAAALGLWLVCGAVAGAAESGGYVTLTNPEGKAIEARIEDVQRDWVTIRLKQGGREMRTEMSMFSEESQAVLRAWVVDRAATERLDFGSAKKRFSSDQNSSEVMTWRISDEGYAFRATNDGMVDIDGVSVKYLIVVKREWIGREKSSDHKLEHFKGSKVFPPIPAGETVRVDSDPGTLKEERMNPGWVPSHGGERDSEDDIEGVIVEFYYRDKLVFTDASPESLLDDYTVDGPRRKRRD